MRLALQEKVGVPRTDGVVGWQAEHRWQRRSGIDGDGAEQAPGSIFGIGIDRAHPPVFQAIGKGRIRRVRQSEPVCGLFDWSQEGSHVVDLDLIGDAVRHSIPGEIRGGICREECGGRRDEHRADGDQRQDGDREG